VVSHREPFFTPTLISTHLIDCERHARATHSLQFAHVVTLSIAAL
jgi:hypothetical protein